MVREGSIVALALTLAACGGGGSTSTPPATGGSGGTPTPTPAPTPTPTPTPVTYTAFNDLSGDQTFGAACAKGASIAQDQQVIRFDEGFTFSFTEANETWTIAGEAPDGSFDTMFGPNDIVQSQPGILTLYQRANSSGMGASELFAFGVPQWPTATATYVRGGFVQSTLSNGAVGSYNCVFGVPTLLEDELPSQVINFTQEIDAAGTLVVFSGTSSTSFDLAPTTFEVSADPTTGEVTLAFQLRGTEFSFDPNTGERIDSTDVVDLGTLNGNATVSDQEQVIVGDLTAGSNSSLSGLFSGWFFGPQGVEIGITVSGREQRTDGSNVSFSFGVTGTQD